VRSSGDESMIASSRSSFVWPKVAATSLFTTTPTDILPGSRNAPAPARRLKRTSNSNPSGASASKPVVMGKERHILARSNFDREVQQFGDAPGATGGVDDQVGVSPFPFWNQGDCFRGQL